MKIIHITASYKPAYIYGGPIMSVAKLCEGIVKAESGKVKAESGKFDLEVFTTTANGPNELAVEVGKSSMFDGVPVIYFKRWTKDHSHFSPGLLWALHKSILKIKTPPLAPSKGGQESNPHEDDAQYINSSSFIIGQRPPCHTGTPPKEKNKIVIHIHAWWNLVSVLCCLIAKWYDIPIILSPRGMLNSHTYGSGNQILKKIIHHSVGKKLLKYCTIHATTNKEKTEIVNFINDKDISVIPNLVALQRENWKSVQRVHVQQIFKIIFLSRINPIKGLEILFDALSHLKFNYHLTIAGSGEEPYVASLKQKAESLKLNGHINWIGQVNNDEKFSIMAEHDLLVLPSYNENFANVIVECLSVGTPVLVSENVGLADYVKANGLGWICSLEPKDIAQKITEAYISVDEREKINDIAANIIKNDFNDEVLVERYLELYTQVSTGSE